MVRDLPLALRSGLQQDGFADAAAAGGFTDAELSLMTRANGAYVVKFRSLELLQALKKYLFGE